MNLKVTKAEYAAKVLGCPDISGCYGSVCEEIEEAVSALGEDEPVVSTKEYIYRMYRLSNLSFVISHIYLLLFIIISKEGKEVTRSLGGHGL